MIENRTFKIVLINENKGNSLEEIIGYDDIIEYKRDKLEIIY
jgi:hypothetical protein